MSTSAHNNKIYVVDASAFITKKRFPGRIVTVPSVEKEIRDLHTRLSFEVQEISVEAPLASTKRRVNEKARITGDIEELSGPDIDLLAKALEYKEMSRDVSLVTDDYAVQNVAIQLGIDVMPVQQKKIRDVLVWEKQCMGCKRRFPEGKVCPVCGSELKKRRKSKI